MSKFVNIKVTANVTTQFYLEVSDNISDKEIKELAEKEVILPSDYPIYIDNILKTRMGININGIDSMLKNWKTDKIEYIIDGGNNSTSEGK